MFFSKKILIVSLILCMTPSASAMEKLRNKIITIKRWITGSRAIAIEASSVETQREVPNGTTPEVYLVEAATRGSLRGVQRAFDMGARLLETRNDEGDTIFHIAARYNHHQLLEYILRENHFGDGNTSPLGATTKNPRGQTPLHVAAQAGNIEAVKVLLAAKIVPINAVDDRLNTPLHEAVCGVYPQIVHVLIAAGADINLENRKEETPYALVLRSTIQDLQTAQIAHLLLRQDSAPLEVKDDNGDTDLHWAVKNGHLLLLKAFLVHASKTVRKKKNREKKTAKELAREKYPSACPEEKGLFHAAFGESSKNPAQIIAALTVTPVLAVTGEDLAPIQDHNELESSNPQPIDPFDPFTPSSSNWQPQAPLPTSTWYSAVKVMIGGIATAFAVKLGYDYFKPAPQAGDKKA